MAGLHPYATYPCLPDPTTIPRRCQLWRDSTIRRSLFIALEDICGGQESFDRNSTMCDSLVQAILDATQLKTLSTLRIRFFRVYLLLTALSVPRSGKATRCSLLTPAEKVGQ